MKRKLVRQEELDALKRGSISNLVEELVANEQELADIFGETSLSLVSFDGDTCLFETYGGEYINASIEAGNDSVKLSNIQKLIIAEESVNEKAEEILGQLLEAIEDGDEAEASKVFDEYIKLDIERAKRQDEAYARLYGTRGKGGNPKLFVRKGLKDPKKVAAAKKAWRKWRSKYLTGVRKRQSHLSNEKRRRSSYKNYYGVLNARSGGAQYTGRRKKKMMKEWLQLSENVFGRIAFNETGEIGYDIKVANDNGEMTITLPNANKKIANRVIQQNLAHHVAQQKVLREQAKKLGMDKGFQKSIAEARHTDVMADDNETHEKLQLVASNHPGVLYLTVKELGKVVHEALTRSGIKGWDDNTVEFLADGIYHIAKDLYPDRVKKLEKLGESFFESLDESARLERLMVNDLTKALEQVNELARLSGNVEVARDANRFLNDLSEDVDNEVLAEVAEWLSMIAETNLEGEEWEVVKDPYLSVTGDNPAMNLKAKKPYNPSTDFSGDYGSPAPVSDGKNYKNGKMADEMGMHGFGNKGGEDVYPDLKNPYSPKAGEFTLSGEYGVDHDPDGLGSWMDDDTYPVLANPYVPKSMIPHQLVDPKNSVE